MSLRHLTISSLAMSSVTVIRMVMQIMIIPILARYLSPTDYGIVALAMPFVLFAMTFSDAGMSASLIRSQSHDKDEWSSSFWMVSGLGVVLAIVISIIGYLSALFLNEPELTYIIAALSLSVILQAISTVPMAKLQQEGRFPLLAAIDMGAMFTGIFSALAAAIAGWGAWALVVQQISHFTVKLFLTLILSTFKPHLFFQLSLIHTHLRFGRDMVFMNFANFLRQSLSNIILGKFLGTAPVGIYSMANMFAELPMKIIGGPLHNVLYPRFASIQDQIQNVRTLFVFMTRIVSILVIPGIAMVAVAHDPIFRLLLSEKWQEAGFVFLYMAPASIALSISTLRGTISLAFGHTNIWLRQVVETSLIFTAVLAVSAYFGVNWVAITYSIAVVLYLPRSLMQILPFINLGLSDYIKIVQTPLLITGLAVGGYEAASHFLNSDWEKFGCAFGLGLATLVLSAYFQKPRIRDEITYLKTHMAS